jgi:aspartyl-tRNA(Asn)/glutamyl-tRNA(Gln) amidotransferase subunit C
MSISLENVRSLSHLARLSLREDEIVSTQKTLNEIVGYVESLQKVDVGGISPMTHAVPMELSLREDAEKPCVGREGLAGSAGFEDGLIRVPKIIE